MGSYAATSASNSDVTTALRSVLEMGRLEPKQMEPLATIILLPRKLVGRVRGEHLWVSVQRLHGFIFIKCEWVVVQVQGVLRINTSSFVISTVSD